MARSRLGAHPHGHATGRAVSATEVARTVETKSEVASPGRGSKMVLEQTQGWTEGRGAARAQRAAEQPVDLSVNPNVKGLTGQARAYDSTLRRTATPDGYVPPPAKKPQRNKPGAPASSAARGPLARLNPGSQSERGEALDKIIDDEGRWRQAAVTGAKLSPVASPRPVYRVRGSAAPLPVSLMPAVGRCLEGGPVGVHGWTKDRLLPATRSQGPTSERALMFPPQGGGEDSGVSQQTTTTRPLRAAVEGRGGAAEQKAPAPVPPMTSVSAVECAAYRENFV